MQHKERSCSAPEGGCSPIRSPGNRITRRRFRSGTFGGWHRGQNQQGYRHSYRSWLDEIGVPLTVQKELMRHATIQTTINIYGEA
jgi:integrase